MSTITDEQAVDALAAYYDDPERAFSQSTVDAMRRALEAAESEDYWEYGYISPHRDDNYMCTTPRTPDNWYGAERPIYRRRNYHHEWEVYDGPVTMELARRPWHKPGTDYLTFPLHYRNPHWTPEFSEWAPERGFEQDIEKYGFRYAVCGRTEDHFPHSKLDGSDYCDGVARES